MLQKGYNLKPYDSCLVVPYMVQAGMVDSDVLFKS